MEKQLDLLIGRLEDIDLPSCQRYELENVITWIILELRKICELYRQESETSGQNVRNTLTHSHSVDPPTL